MKKEVKIYYLIGIFILFSLYFINAGTTNISNCTVLNTANGIYELNISINSSLDCLNISAANITLDCKNYNISFGNSSGGRGIFVDNGTGVGYDNITIKNCYLIQNESGINDTAIFLGEYSNNSVIFNNTIETYGEETAGINVESNSVNANITANNVYTNGSSAHGIRLGEGGDNAIIEENLLLTFGNDSSSILIGEGAHDSEIVNNSIINLGNKTSSDAMGGIFLEVNTFNLNVSNNTIVMGEIGSLIYGGESTAGIWIWGDNSTIDNNIIWVFGESNNGIYLNTCEGINISVNIIIEQGNNSNGIRSEMINDSAVPSIFYNNIISTFGDNSSGIYLNQSSNNTILSNYIVTFGEYSHGIFFNQSHTTNLSDNSIAVNDSTSYVLYLITSAEELVYDNLFVSSNASSGVYVKTSSSSDFNATKISGTNIVGENYIGGNYWTNINSNGYSDYCANWDDDYICDSSYTVALTDFIDYLPLTSHINTTAPSGGSGGGGYLTFRPTEEQLKEGYTKQLSSRSKIIFEIENLSHTFKVDSVSKTNAKISISSETQEATFLIGEEKRFGFSGDGSYDILVKLNSIISSKANFTMQTIQEETPVPDEEIIGQTEEETDDSLEGGINEGDDIENNSPLKWILVGVFFLLIGFVVYKSIKKEKKRYY